MFWHRVEKDGDRPAQQWKEGGAWRTRSWRQVGEIVRELATGLLALGRRKDEAVGILSASRAEWVAGRLRDPLRGLPHRSRSTRPTRRT